MARVGAGHGDGTGASVTLAVVAGTGTEVGKTWVAAQVAVALRAAGKRVAVRKPAQSFDPGGGPTDAELLAAASGEDPFVICPEHRWYEVPMAPFMAADVLARAPFSLADLVQELTWPAGVDLRLVESAGGVRSPITSDGADTVDLVHAIEPDLVLLVADAGLGTINAVRLCADALAPTALLVVLNRYDDGNELHSRNREWLVDHLPIPIVASVDAVVDALMLDDPTLPASPAEGL